MITGASRGIGLALVKWFSANHHKVWALSRNTTPITQLNLPNVTVNALDLTDEDAVAAWSKNEAPDNIDALINNAGTLLNQPFSETTKEDFEKIYSVNVFGLASLTRLLLPIIAPKGHVVNISSMGGIGGSSKFAGLAAYSSSKGAVNILTELLAEEYKETGPSFNTLALGAVQTEMLAQAFPGFKAPLSAKEMAEYIFKFSMEGHNFFNGKTIPVSSSTP